MNNNEKLAKIAVNKSLLKEYSNSSNDRIVYMNDNTEFQIQIFNPYSYVIGVSFKFNDNSPSSQLLVLKPGERVWLDRYLNNESKLLFSTYEVGTSEAVQKAIANNGNITIKFYKEKENYNNISYINASISCPSSGIYYDGYGSSSCVLNALNTNDYQIKTYCDDNSITSCADAIQYTSACSSTSASTCASYSSTLDLGNPKSLGGRSFSKSRSMETGRIEKGSHSNQKFNQVYTDFETWPFKTETIKILPTSQKQVNANDLTKKYCYNCGRKLSQKYKFCPFCGAKQ